MSFTWLAEAIRNDVKRDVFTSIPAVITAYDPETQLAQVQIQIMAKSAEDKDLAYPVIIEVPVQQYGGLDFAVEIQIDIGTEGMLHFAHRCIETWKETGELSKQELIRFHDANDCYFIPGVRSKPNALSSHSNNGIRIRNKDASEYIWLKSDSTADIVVPKINIVGDINHQGNTEQVGNVELLGNIEQTGNIELTGNVETDGNIEATGKVEAPDVIGSNDVEFAGISAKGHVHDKGNYLAPSGPLVSGNSGGPS